MSSDNVLLVQYALSILAVLGAVVSLGGAVWHLAQVIQHIRKTVPIVAYLTGPLILMSRNVDEEAKRPLRRFWRCTAILVLCLVAIALFYPFPTHR